jgi:hypothetical protein
MGENDRAILGNVFAERDARLDIAQQARQRRFAVEEREIAQILSTLLDQIEGIEDRLMASRRRRSSMRDKPSGPSTTASPSMVKLLASMRAAAVTIAGSLAIQSFALAGLRNGG